MFKTEHAKYLVSSFLLTAIFSFFTHDKYLTQVDESFRKSSSEIVLVEMTNTMKFVPDTVTIQTGDTIKWENTSMLVHSVTGDPSIEAIKGSAELPDQALTFNSGMMDPDETFEHKFNIEGTYQYFCIPHEGTKMYGWIIVK